MLYQEVIEWCERENKSRILQPQGRIQREKKKNKKQKKDFDLVRIELRNSNFSEVFWGWSTQSFISC